MEWGEGKGERKRDASADRAIISAGEKLKTGLGWIGLVRANIRPEDCFACRTNVDTPLLCYHSAIG